MNRALAITLCICFAASAARPAAAEVVASQRYESWARHKPGTSVTRTIENRVGTETSTADVKQTLVEVTPDKVVLELTMKMTRLGKSETAPTRRVELPAKMEKYIDLVGVGIKATFTEVRTEPVEIIGRSLTCRVIEFIGEQTPLRGGSPVRVSGTIWVSDEIPGAIVQIIQNAEIVGPDGTKVEGVTSTAVAAVEIKQ